MPTISEFNASSTPYIEIQKCSQLRTRIMKDYPVASGAKTTALTNLQTLITNWQTKYDEELADETIDEFPSAVATQVTALQATYSAYTAND